MRKSVLWILLLLTSCMELPEGVRQSLDLAGNNKRQLKKVLRHYNKNEADTLKFRAALFLIDHMKWHGNQTVTECQDSTIPKLVVKADSFYTATLGDTPNPEMEKKEILQQLDSFAIRFQNTIKKMAVAPPVTRTIAFNDLENINAEFLISHIDNAFDRWENSPYARNLPFDDFCEYLLPYRALHSNSLTLDGGTLYKQIGKQLERSEPYTLVNIVDRYNRYLRQMRNMLGSKPVEAYYGYYEMFFKKKFECVEQCEMECNVLRACGIPTAIDINIGNREFVGQHHHCVIIDTLGKPRPFNGESGFPRGKNWGYWPEIKLNIYRSLFGAQSDSPLFLKKTEEQIPINFRSPCMKDVTSYIKKVYPLTLKIDRKTENNLVWLYTYANSPEGIRAITWGITDSTGRAARFSNVVADMIYFPAVLNSQGEPEFCHTPIYVNRNLEEKKIIVYPLSHFFSTGQPDSVRLLLTRKFPYKENMQKLAEAMIGGKFYGANRKDESDRKELYTITEAPGPFLNEFRLNNKKAWKYYIYQAPEKKYADISILEFLTEASRGYPNTTPATPLEIFRPEDKTINNREYVKIIPQESEGKKAEYDGNMQTSSDRKKIVFEIDTPQIITRIRMAPKNADNIIKPHENYELMVWNNGWKSLENTYSQYNYLEFDNLSTQKLYWLRNHSRGREEVPFIIRNGEAAFIYYDLMQTIEYEEFVKIDNNGWICKASSEEGDNSPYEPGFARFAIDNDNSTCWHSQYTGQKFSYPHWLEIDTKQINEAAGFFVHPRGRDIARRILFETSVNGQDWTKVGQYIMNQEGTEQRFEFEKIIGFRYFRITFLDGYDPQPFTSIIETGILKEQYPIENN